MLELPINKTEFSSTSTLSPNTWYYITAVVDRNNKLYIYINGVLDAENNDNSSGTIDSTDEIYLSAQKTAGSFGSTYYLTGDLFNY